MEWVNRIRTDPAGEYDRLVTSESPLVSPIAGVASAMAYFGVNLPMLSSELAALASVAPLAWSSALNDAARAHNQAMIAADTQSHQLPGEAGLGARITQAGYSSWSNLGENIYAFAEGAAYAHAGFVVDWGAGPGGMQTGRGHRANIMNHAFREVGIAITAESSPLTSVGPLVITQDFGNRFTLNQAILLGVVFSDTNGNGLFTAGEGFGGVAVTVSGAAGTFSTTTFVSGGYQLSLPAGSYTVTFSGGGLAAPVVKAAEIGGQNVKLDVAAGDTGGGGGGGGGGSQTFVSAGATVVGVVEGGQAFLTLVRSGSLSGSTTVRLVRASGGTAFSDDHLPLENDGWVEFQPGQSTAVVGLRAHDDTQPETTESAFFDLVAESGGQIASPSRVTVMIEDNDSSTGVAPYLLDARAVAVNRKTTTIVVELGGDVDARTARRNSFVLRRQGRDRVLGNKNDLRLGAARVSFSEATGQWMVTFRTRLKLGETAQLIVKPALVRGLTGLRLAGETTRLVSWV
jgi:hypothetical protein